MMNIVVEPITAKAAAAKTSVFDERLFNRLNLAQSKAKAKVPSHWKERIPKILRL